MSLDKLTLLIINKCSMKTSHENSLWQPVQLIELLKANIKWVINTG